MNAHLSVLLKLHEAQLMPGADVATVFPLEVTQVRQTWTDDLDAATSSAQQHQAPVSLLQVLLREHTTNMQDTGWVHTFAEVIDFVVVCCFFVLAF